MNDKLKLKYILPVRKDDTSTSKKVYSTYVILFTSKSVLIENHIPSFLYEHI